MAEVLLRKCQLGHLEVIQPQAVQEHEQIVMLSPGNVETILSAPAFSMWVGNRCLAAAGVVPFFPHRGLAWALLSRDIGAYMLPAVRKMRRYLDLDPTKRIEMYVNADFEAGKRFAKLVGMTLETPEPLRYHGAYGEDEYVYSRIK